LGVATSSTSLILAGVKAGMSPPRVAGNAWQVISLFLASCYTRLLLYYYITLGPDESAIFPNGISTAAFAQLSHVARLYVCVRAKTTEPDAMLTAARQG